MESFPFHGRTDSSMLLGLLIKNNPLRRVSFYCTVMPKNLIIIVAALIAVGALPIPFHGYYVFLRIAACISFVLIAFNLVERDSFWFWGCLVFGFLFNPIFPMYMPKDAWMVLDILAAIFLFFGRNKMSTD